MDADDDTRTRRDLSMMARLAGEQAGVLATREILALGHSHAAIYRYRDEGILHPRRRGVWAFGSPVLSREGEWYAALRSCPGTAALAGFDAAAYWGITRRKRWRCIEVLSDRASRRSLHGMRVSVRADIERCSVVVGRLRVLTAAWTIVTLAAVVPKGELVRMIYQGVFLHVLDVNELLELSSDGSRRPGATGLRDALRAYLDGEEGSDSRLEDRVVMYLPVIAYDELRQNLRVRVGAKEYRLDIAYERLRISIEPGSGYHDDKVVARDDRIRRAALEGAGWTLVDIRARDFDRDPIRATAPARRAILAAAAAYEDVRRRPG
jgi:hypothetical protein